MLGAAALQRHCWRGLSVPTCFSCQPATERKIDVCFLSLSSTASRAVSRQNLATLAPTWCQCRRVILLISGVSKPHLLPGAVHSCSVASESCAAPSRQRASSLCVDAHTARVQRLCEGCAACESRANTTTTAPGLVDIIPSVVGRYRRQRLSKSRDRLGRPQ